MSTSAVRRIPPTVACSVFPEAVEVVDLFYRSSFLHWLVTGTMVARVVHCILLPIGNWTVMKTLLLLLILPLLPLQLKMRWGKQSWRFFTDLAKQIRTTLAQYQTSFGNKDVYIALYCTDCVYINVIKNPTTINSLVTNDWKWPHDCWTCNHYLISYQQPIARACIAILPK